VYKEHFATSIHLQNAQLYAFGALANGAIVMLSSSGTASVVDGGGEGEGDDGFSAVPRSSFRGFGTPSTWFVTLTLAAFGIASSLIMKHLSNIAKVFNSAAGMVVVTIASMAFLGTKVTLPFFLAAAVIVASLVSFYGGGESGGSSRDADRAHVLGPGSGASVFTSRAEDDVVRNATPGTPLSSRGSFAFDAPDANETKQLL